MSLQSELLKIQVNAEAEGVKAERSDDFRQGFDYACQLLSDYLLELTQVYQEELSKEKGNASPTNLL